MKSWQIKRVCARDLIMWLQLFGCWLSLTRHIPSWHFKDDIFCCVCSLDKRGRETEWDWKRASKTEMDGDALQHAKYINISIWCLILFPLLLTLLAPVALITGPEWAFQAQGHVVGVCYGSATWSRRCLLGPGTPACWHGEGSDCSGKLKGSNALLHNLGHTCRACKRTQSNIFLCSWLYLSPIVCL